ncbi:MAG TPA: lysylphosphatidylglycerol synthase domain-containing protein [Nocardioides sp.]|nr:lysylphosphatidylglycerol synthase domain-containing protein [Nocardioides sp.]
MRWVRVLGGAAILAVVAWRLGPQPFADAVRSAGPASLLAALAITALTTVACAWRWRALACRLGVDVPLRDAVAAYYRSQFLNATLPGGVVGDVHRAVRHGALPVVADRGTGQAVQVVAAGAVLLLGPAPWASALLGVAVVAALVRWPAVVATSVVAASGHVVVFLVAARAAGTAASLVDLVPLALLVMLAAAVPLNVAGWGPREGVAAWAFAAGGLGAAQGATVAVLYGVLALVATLPGAVLLTRGAVRG